MNIHRAWAPHEADRKNPVKKDDYVPACEREGWDESKIIKLPSEVPCRQIKPAKAIFRRS
jgi:hypothetical protein